MRKAAAVALEEVADKLLIFPAALLVGFFPVALAAFRPRPVDARDASAFFLALVTAATLAVFLGARSTAGDLASGRAAFHLARPLTAFQLWFGKLAGSLLVVFGAAALALLPSAVAGASFRGIPGSRVPGAIPTLPADPAGLALAAAGALAALFLFSQAAGVAALARSPLLAADAALAAAALFVAARTAGRLRSAGAIAPRDAALAILAAVVAAAAAVGCYAAVTEGTDVKRAAAGQSRAFWSIAGAAVALFALFGAWVLRARPADLTAVWWASPAPSGDWIAETGPARWHRPVFLENLRTGEFLRAGSLPVISADGATAAWSSVEPGVPEPTFVPRTVSLSDSRHPGTVWETKGLHEAPLLVFSPDSRRLAIIASDRIAVWDAARGGMLAAARPGAPLWKESRGFTAATFAGDDRLRIFAARPAAGGRTTLEILELDVAAKRLRTAGSAGPFRGTFPIVASPDRSRLLVREAGATVHLLDGETGRSLAVFSGADASFRSAIFLADGRIALFESIEAAGRLRTLSSDGAGVASFPVPDAEHTWLLGELRPGVLVMAAFRPRAGRGRTATILVADLATGTLERWGSGVLPAAPFAAALGGDPAATPAPGSLGARLFFTPQGTLVALDGPGRFRPIHPAR